MGERALLLEVDTLDAAIALHRGLEASRIAGVIDLVPAARTVLVRVDPMLTLAAARAWIATATTDAASAAGPEPGSSSSTSCTTAPTSPRPPRCSAWREDELVHRHASAEWTVAFTGFAPGFGYLVSPDWPYDVPRLAQPAHARPEGRGRPGGALHRRVPA